MKIKKMRASFGKLSGEIELGEGLNIIRAPNESGKSTWSAFIRAMLYGIDTRERDSAQHIADKNRYQPWSGAVMTGRMELESGGDEITIFRAPAGGAPFKSLSAVYTGTNEPVERLNTSAAGEILTGVPEQVFTRTAYIRQAGVTVDGDPELEKRISALVSTGDERRSYTQTDEQLRKWQRGIKYNRSGKIPALETEIKNRREKLARMESIGTELAESSRELEKLEAREKRLETDMDTYRIIEREQAQQRIIDARRRAKLDKENYENAEKDLMRDGKLITNGELDELKSDIAVLSERYKILRETGTTRDDTRERLTQAREKLAKSPFSGKDARETGSIAAKAKELEEAAQNPPPEKRSAGRTATLIILVLLGIAGMAAGIYTLISAILPPAAAVAILAFAAIMLISGAVFLTKKPEQSKSEERRYREYLAFYGFEDTQSFAKAVSDYTADCQTAQALETALELAEKNAAAAASALDEVRTRAAERAKKLIPGIRKASDIPAGIAKLEEELSRLQTLKFNMLSSESVYESIRGEDEPESVQHTNPPPRNRSETQKQLSECSEAIGKCKEKLNYARGAQKILGDPVMTGSEILGLEEELRRQNKQYGALSIAIEALRAANISLQTRFSPVISETAGKMMARLTGGKYGNIVFSKDFSASIREDGDISDRNLLLMSSGTRDQAYLALRLALAELMPGDEKCPIILDDALTNFDDERMGQAMELLLDLAKERQIILFTCHSREAEYLRGREEVNFIKL